MRGLHGTRRSQDSSFVEVVVILELAFEATLYPKKTSYPLDKYCLYFSGNEGFLPYREKAKPAPRGPFCDSPNGIRNSDSASPHP